MTSYILYGQLREHHGMTASYSCYTTQRPCHLPYPRHLASDSWWKTDRSLAGVHSFTTGVARENQGQQRPEKVGSWNPNNHDLKMFIDVLRCFDYMVIKVLSCFRFQHVLTSRNMCLAVFFQPFLNLNHCATSAIHLWCFQASNNPGTNRKKRRLGGDNWKKRWSQRDLEKRTLRNDNRMLGFKRENVPILESSESSLFLCFKDVVNGERHFYMYVFQKGQDLGATWHWFPTLDQTPAVTSLQARSQNVHDEHPSTAPRGNSTSGELLGWWWHRKLGGFFSSTKHRGQHQVAIVCIRWCQKNPMGIFCFDNLIYPLVN